MLRNTRINDHHTVLWKFLCTLFWSVYKSKNAGKWTPFIVPAEMRDWLSCHGTSPRKTSLKGYMCCQAPKGDRWISALHVSLSAWEVCLNKSKTLKKITSKPDRWLLLSNLSFPHITWKKRGQGTVAFSVIQHLEQTIQWIRWWL